MASRQQCAFIQFTARASAEVAAEKTFNKLILNGRRLNVKWGKSQANQLVPVLGETERNNTLQPVPGLPGALPIAPDFFNLSEVGSNTPAGGQPNSSAPSERPTNMIGYSHRMGGPMMRRPPPMPPHLARGPRPHFFPGMMPPPMPFGMLRPPPMRMPPMGFMPPRRPPVPPMMPPPPLPGAIHYPSQDPSRMGSAQAAGSDRNADD